MNKIGENQCRDILDSFAWDSTGYEESPDIRARERADSHVFYFRDWFNIVTGRGLREGRFFKIYQNTFGALTTNLEEDGVVSLCARVRDLDSNDSKNATKNSSGRIRKEKKKQLKNKQVEKQTYLGEEHARESLYGTIEECLESGEELIIEEGKSKEAQVVIDYLKYLELERKICRLQQQGVDLDKEDDEVNKKIISLKEELKGLENKHTTLQEQRKNLQGQQKGLQEAQDELLR